MRNISFGSTYRRFSFFGYLAILFSLFVALTVIGTAFASVTPKISGGASHTIALKSDGTVWAWGANTWGQLGDGTKNYSNYRVQVVGLTDVIAIAAGSYHTVALKSDGTVWTWGSNLYGQLGDGTNTNRNTPVQVSGLNNIVAIA
ncbi:MAG: RCC1 repeat- and reductase domain-containing protein, partial [Candidatus Brocadia sp.]|nr:RCC1 repeat- and reductase domain-containing protein [Candidatus Brocadia sp.]